MKLLYRYILKNLYKSFFMFLALFSVIIISSQFMHLPSVVYFMNIFEFIKLVFFVDFSFFKYQLLFAVFLSAVIVGYNIRENRELYAIYSSGISKDDILKPVKIFSVLFFILSFFVSFFLVPYANRERANFVTVNVKRYFLESVQPKNFSKISSDIVIYAEKKENRKIDNLFIYLQKKGQTITAQKAEFNGTNLILKNGFIQIPEKNGFNILFFKEYTFNIDVKYVKRYSMENYKNKKLFEIAKGNSKKKNKAVAILTDRFTFSIPFIFIGLIGFLLGIQSFKGREFLVSVAVVIAIGYMLLNFLFIKLVSSGFLPFFVHPVVIFVYFWVIYRYIYSKT